MAPESFKAGTQLGPYVILAQIGAGGMGRVYKARDTRLDRLVAIKLPSRAVDERFQREARAAAALNHPHICTIYDIGVVDGLPFIATELLEGQPLNQRIHGRPLPLAEALEFALQIADALEAAHARGIVHRDIKPANIFITSDARVKLLDFGLAMFAPSASPDQSRAETMAMADASLTLPGMTVGTAAYMSPEQARADTLDARTDLFSFGAVLYEMVTGVAAFPGHSMATIFDAVLNHSPQPPSRLVPETPAEMERIISKALEKDRTMRYQSASEMRADLKRLARDSSSPVVAAGPSTRPRRRGLVMGAVALAAIAAIGLSSSSLRRRLTGAGGPRQIRSIAVLPLANLSADKGEEYFSDGMTEELIATLYKIHALRVTSRTSVMQYKAARKALPQIARELNVDAVIEGSVMRSGDQVRITAKLVEAKTEQNLWADTYDRDVRDVLSLQADVAKAIADQVQITLTPQEQQQLSARAPVDPEVFQLYLKGRAAFNEGTEDSAVKSIGYFQQVIAQDPRYAPAYAGMARAYGSLTPFPRAPKDVMPKAREQALKAIALDDNLSEAHTALADVYLRFDWNWTDAEKELKRALELNPSSAEAHDMYSGYCSALGRNQEAIAEATIAHQLDPLSMMIWVDLVGALMNAREYDRSIAEARKALAGNPDAAFALAWMGMGYMMKGDFAQAIPPLVRAHELDPNVTITHFLGVAQAAAGNRAEAQKLVASLEAAAKTQYVCAYEVAEIHARLGDNDKAFQWLQKGLSEQCDCLIWLRSEPWMDPLRVDPRYLQLLKHVRFPGN